MSIFTLISVFSVCPLTLRKNILKTLFLLDFLSITNIFYPSGESIIPHLLCCDAFAVQKYSFIRRRLASVAFSTRELFMLKIEKGQ